jgi:hypothetical protein
MLACLFSVTTHQVFPVINHREAIYSCEVRGPNFGLGELKAYREPFNEEKRCRSWANREGYKIPLDVNGHNALTREPDGQFTITELEVWEVKLSHLFNKEEYIKRV